MKRIVISDLHIGSQYCKYDELAQFLKDENYDQLILAGDIVDLIKVPTFDDRAKKIIEVLNFNKDIIYIVGNHDISFKGLIGQEVFGIKIVDSYEFQENGLKFRIQHGDQYDSRGFVKYHFCATIISVIQNFLETIFPYNFSAILTQYEKKKRKLRKIWDILKWNEGIDVFIMGHEHMPEVIIWINEENKVLKYINCGDWVSHSTYVSIIDGETRLKKYDYKDKFGN